MELAVKRRVPGIKPLNPLSIPSLEWFEYVPQENAGKYSLRDVCIKRYFAVDIFQISMLANIFL